MKAQDYKFSIIDLAVSESYKEEEAAKKRDNKITLMLIKKKLGRQARKMASVVDGQVYVGPYKFGNFYEWYSLRLVLMLENGGRIEINNLADLGSYIRDKQK